eukprot:310338-Alexandrium_andersonii.AAC.1
MQAAVGADRELRSKIGLGISAASAIRGAGERRRRLLGHKRRSRLGGGGRVQDHQVAPVRRLREIAAHAD